MILKENYEENQVLEDVFFPITKDINDKRIRLGIALYHPANDEVDDELNWARVQLLKEAMTARRPNPCAGSTWVPPAPIHYVRSPSSLSISTIPSEDHDAAARARRKIQEIEDFDKKTWGLAYGALDLWNVIKEFVINVAVLLGSIGTLAKRRIVKYWSNKLIHWGEEINNVRQENRTSRRR